MPKTFKGKSTKLGGGGQFAMMQSAIEKTGKSAAAAAAIAATAGRKKYGASTFQKMAVTGRKRAAKKG